MNRVLCFLRDVETERRRRRQAAAEATCKRINDLVGTVIESCCRTIDPTDSRIHFCLIVEIEPTEDYDGAAVHLAGELRRASDEILQAAATLEGGAE